MKGIKELVTSSVCQCYAVCNSVWVSVVVLDISGRSTVLILRKLAEKAQRTQSAMGSVLRVV